MWALQVVFTAWLKRSLYSGLEGTAPEIINRWFHEFFPRAYKVGKELEAMGNQTNARLKFTAQSWLVSLFLDCPNNYAVRLILDENSFFLGREMSQCH